jgi:hypothetical protein
MSSRDLAEASQAEKETEALLRDARSADRRIDKLVLTASGNADAYSIDADQVLHPDCHAVQSPSVGSPCLTTSSDGSPPPLSAPAIPSPT